MEHTMHICFILAAFILFLKIRQDNFITGKKTGLFLCIIGLLPLIRYESIFFIFAIICMLCIYKQFKLALATLVCALLPMTLFGIYSITMGGFFFPNSLLLKGDIASDNNLYGLVRHYLLKLWNSLGVPLFYIPIISLLTIIALDFAGKAQYNLKSIINLFKDNAMVFITFAAVLLHGLFAGFGWLYRYEAYLFVLLYLSFYLVAIKKTELYKKGRAILIAALFILLFPYSVDRLRSSRTVIKTAGKNVYDQQIQMSRFLHTYYDEEKVMANDIGAITYYSNIDLLDLIGLGTNSVLKHMLKYKLYGRALWVGVMGYVTKYPYNQYKIILVYDHWFGLQTQENYERLGWIKAAELTIKNNVICGGDTVSFYTSDYSMLAELKENLIQFKDDIPEDVSITIFDEE
jgi:hypothetical protein